MRTLNKSVLVDLDGVLVDACEWHYEALNKALYQISDYTISKDDHDIKFNGLPTKKKLNMLVDLMIVRECDIPKILECKQEYTIQYIEEFCKYSNSKVTMMNALKDMGYKIGCVTNCIRQTAELMLKKTGIISYFDIIITNEDCRYNKPHPEPYIKALVELNSLPENSIIVEDSIKGLEAARMTGCVVVEVEDSTQVTKKIFEGGDRI